MSAFRRCALLLAALLLAGAAGAAGRATQTITRVYLGITHVDRTETVPRPLRIHVMDIDLAAPGLRFTLTPHRGGRETIKEPTLQLLTNRHA